ncbi:TonB-dependent receptor [Chitinophagaceae bacterium LB-8]|uniref:TonB-dependent receptor n=1 Tax=Paraflavisolibacter caeni TaxID=2982496 RepID=A0A9X3B814_9BACT|nr:TonB-dependent receptor [Paraflavisolibacter caeni]MCU7549950.1 TonB-dependent receptor [Paraflavisolibacter caeni]
MKKLLAILVLLCTQSTWAQNTLITKVTSSDTHQPLAGATISVPQLKITKAANANGVATINNLPAGNYQTRLSYVGFQDTSFSLSLPYSDTLFIELQPAVKEEEQVIINSTRTNNRIADLPLRVEVLGTEELAEESGIKPGNMASLLGDLSVIHIQNTSSVTGSSIVRLQGLDGRYTQLLRDGLPVYEGLNTNFGILSIPPLDLKQVEIIKGSASTLYGGGAIAGLINFISKTPKQQPELTALLNRSTLKENNANLYYAQRWKKTGLTLFAGTTIQDANDVNDDGFSDVPRLRQYNLHPKFFIYPTDRQTLTIGYNGTIEDRKGGDMYVLEHEKTNEHQYTETAKSNRHSMDLQYNNRFSNNGNLVIKSAGSLFNLDNTEPDFSLHGQQFNTYTEASYNQKIGSNDLVAGINYLTESFTKKKEDTSQFVDYNYNTIGVFVQDDWHITDKFIAEGGIRADYHSEWGWFALPRIAFAYKPIHELSIRLSAGAGYKVPNVFTQQSEQVDLSEMNPSVNNLEAERSKGINCDINYHTKWNDWEFTINQALYYTHIGNTVLPVLQSNGKYSLTNQPFNSKSTGTDTYVLLAYGALELYAGYNHTIARYTNDKNNYILFAPQDKFGSTLAYEIDGKWRMGLESAWVGNQYIEPTKKAPDYWFWAAMIQRNLGKHLSLVLNGENLFDERQGKNEPLYAGNITNPDFLPIWGLIEGRVINLSVKWTNFIH